MTIQEYNYKLRQEQDLNKKIDLWINYRNNYHTKNYEEEVLEPHQFIGEALLELYKSNKDLVESKVNEINRTIYSDMWFSFEDNAPTSKGWNWGENYSESEFELEGEDLKEYVYLIKELNKQK